MAKKSTLAWIQGITCNGNSHSFLNYPYLEHFFEEYEILYHPIFLASLNFLDLLDSDIKIDVLVIEGALTHKKALFQDTIRALMKLWTNYFLE